MVRLFQTAALLILLVSTGCALLVAGTGAGAGVYTYVKGELIRSYNAGYNVSVSAAEAGLSELKIDIVKKTIASIKTELNARRSDGSPVVVKIKMIQPNVTEISVRCGHIGYWDRKVSELVHATISQKLSAD